MIKQTTVHAGGTDYVIRELPGSLALEYSALIGRVAAGILAGIGDFTGEVGGTEIHMGKSVQNLVDRLLDKENLPYIKRLLSETMVEPQYTDQFFELNFRASELPALYELVGKIVMFNFGGIGDVLKKKTALFTSLFSLFKGNTTTE